MENRFVKQIRVGRIALIVIILVTTFVALFASGCFLKSLLEADTESCFEFIDDRMDVSYTEDLGYSVQIRGKVKIKYKDFSYAKFTYYIYDADGNNLGEVYFSSLFGLTNGSTVTFRAESDEYFETRPVSYELNKITAVEDKFN